MSNVETNVEKDGFHFGGMLKVCKNVVSSDGDVKLGFSIETKVVGESQNFLEEFAEEFAIDNVNGLFREPVRWSKLDIDTCSERMTVKFDVMEFVAELSSVRVKSRETKDETVYTYTFLFEKSQSRDIDIAFASYLKYKEEDEAGKKHLAEYDVVFSCL